MSFRLVITKHIKIMNFLSCVCSCQLYMQAWCKKVRRKLSNAYNINWFLLLTKFSAPVNLPTYIISSLFNNTRSSDVVTLARPPAACSLKIRDCAFAFQYASPHLLEKLPFSLRESVLPLYAYFNQSFFLHPSPFHFFILNSKLTFLVNCFNHRSLTTDNPDWLPRQMVLCAYHFF